MHQPTIESTPTRLRRLTDAHQAAQEHADDAKEARDQAIEQADQEGLPTLQIARITGIPRSTVKLIITSRVAARQARATRPIEG